MKVRAQVPLRIYLASSSTLAPVCTSFKHKRYVCGFRFISAAPIQLDIPGRGQTHTCEVTHMEIEIDDGNLGLLRPLLDEPNWPDLVVLLCKILNRCIQSIRNFGTVVHLRELHINRSGNHKLTLQFWSTAFSDDDGLTWELLVPQPPVPLAGLAALLGGNVQVPMIPTNPSVDTMAPLNAPELWLDKWPAIEEAIRDDIRPGPHQEFITNAIEHLHQRRFRLAVMESVIALEILVTGYLTAYFTVRKNFSEKKAKELLRQQFGLRDRLLLLESILDERELRRVDFQKVRKLVGWRNKVAHESGNLPKEPTEEVIRDHLVAAMVFVSHLAVWTNQLESLPEIQKIGLAVSAEHSLPVPKIDLLPLEHSVVFEFILSEQCPDIGKMERIASDLAARLRTRDPRFEPDQHFGVRFVQCPSVLVAVWRSGRLEMKSPHGAN